MAKLEGKVVIITGGASGIGAAATRLFVEEGARVVVADIDSEAGQTVALDLKPSAIFVEIDVRSEPNMVRLMTECTSHFGEPDSMINNAGSVGAYVPLDQMTVDAFDDALAVLLRGVFLGMKHAAPIMQRRQKGTIINVASIAGVRGGYAPHSYSAAKAGVIQLTRTGALELAEYGVRVNCICPGHIATPLLGTAIGLTRTAAKHSVSYFKELLDEMQPLQRSGLAEDVARAMLWLASDDSSFVTGESLVVDGGLLAGRTKAESAAAALKFTKRLAGDSSNS